MCLNYIYYMNNAIDSCSDLLEVCKVGKNVINNHNRESNDSAD